MSNIDTENGGATKSPKKGDKVEVVRILILAVVSFVLGFGLVIFFLGPGESSTATDLPDLSGEAEPPTVSSEAAPSESAPTAASAPATAEVPEAANEGGYAPAAGENPLLPTPTGESVAADAEGSAGSSASVDEASLPPEVPPGKTPENVNLDGSAFYLKCWDTNGAETPGASCDRLTVFEKRMATRLYVVDRCKQQHSGAKAEGKLSLGVEVDFGKASLSFWNGPSSTLENAAKVATCLRTELNGLPIQGVEHKASKYRMFYTVLFGKGKAEKPADKTAASPSSTPDESAKKLPTGKSVTVVKDQVRVRKSPVDGEIIGKIGKDNQVQLIGKKGEWCRIVTPNNNEGWMICEALSK